MDGREYTAFGLSIRSDVPLVGLGRGSAAGPITTISLAGAAELDADWPGSERVLDGILPDGRPCRSETGTDGSLRIAYGDQAVYVLNADTSTIRCAPADPSSSPWLRFLLDAVLLKASERHGFEALHAGAVLAREGVLAFATRSGGGKSSLVSELVRRGYPLFADDALVLASRGGGVVVAHPAPALMSFPLDHPEGIDPEQLGQVRAVVGAEAWLQVSRTARDPAVVAAIHLLDRRPGSETGMDLLDPSPVPLLPHQLTGGGGRERVAARFGLLADLAQATPLKRLRADPSVPVRDLADLVERGRRPAP